MLVEKYKMGFKDALDFCEEFGIESVKKSFESYFDKDWRKVRKIVEKN